ncbi:hypothetical protein COJ96_25155 [Bacillus sp. AFS073361]|nr:hypothetical protein COJ96_25155 [Bacillus sp. AFS073361]
MGNDFYADTFILAVGFLAIYMFFHATRERFYNNKTYDQVRYITQFALSFNFWFIKNFISSRRNLMYCCWDMGN